MKKEELKEKIELLKSKLENDKIDLIKEYIESNNSIKKGDIIKDHIGSIKVESLKYYISENEPCAIYFGIELNKNGLENKRGNKRKIYQCNLIKNDNKSNTKNS